MTIFKYTTEMGHEQVVFCNDKATGLKAIIAIHDTTLGPALGGCRLWNYPSEEEALYDVLRLSRGMTYKNAIAGLHLGGGKAVIIGDPKTVKSEALFRAFGRFVHSLSGRYITAEDVNINVNDMEYVGLETPYVSGLSSHPNASGDPSPFTALGVYHGIHAAVKFALGKENIDGLTIAVQGCGSVGRNLLELLSKHKVQLIVSDIDTDRVKKVAEKFNAKIVEVDRIHAQQCDVYAPCALGAILNDKTIPEIKAKVIAGGSNNQLAEEDKHGRALRERGILYTPDYVINAGGVINVFYELKDYNVERVRNHVGEIYQTLLNVFATAEKEGIPTHIASARLAERRIASVRNMVSLSNNFDSLNKTRK